MLAIAILAGDKKRKALLKINQKTLGEIVLNATKDIEAYKILVARKKVLSFYKNYIDKNYIEFDFSASNFLKNHIKVINKVKVRGINEIIFVHCDLPLLTRESLENFIDKAINENTELILPICNAKCIKKELPDYKFWKWKTKDFEFVVGNVYYLKARRLKNRLKNKGFINLLYKYRNKRNPFNWFFIISGFLAGENIGLVKYIKDFFNIYKGIYDLSEISKSISRILFGEENCYKLVEINDPALYIDIDNKRDLECVRQYLDNRFT